MLSIKNLNAGYGELQILKDVSLDLKEGTMSVLMGPNGAGKSTLLRSIYNLTDISGGEISFKGEKITRKPAHSLLKRGIAFVSQGKVNFDLLTVEENLRLGAHHIKDKAFINRQLEKIYEMFPVLREKRKQRAYSLSGGQQQMLAIGRALMVDPALILMDEPSLGLAPKLVKEVFATIERIKKEFGTTILIVEHNIKSLFDHADYAFVLMNGELVAADTCKNLKDSEIMQKVFVG